MRKFLAIVFLLGPAFLALAFAVLWGTLALWYKLPLGEALRWIIAACFALLGLRVLSGFFVATKRGWYLTFGAVFAGLLLFWVTLKPPTEEAWSPEVARQVTGTIDGDTLTLSNMRDFQWRTATDFDENWVTRTYDLSKLETVDLFMSYWGGPTMAHLMLSFGFSDDQYLTWSIEVRRTEGESFSPIADFFKANTVSLVASAEKDAVGLRSNVQKASVRIFRLNATPSFARDLLEQYVTAANSLAEEPIFFNSLFTNCSMGAIRLAVAANAKFVLDWRVLVNGYFPDYLYEHGSVQTSVTLEELYERGDISKRAREVGLTDTYSQAIRVGVPGINP